MSIPYLRKACWMIATINNSIKTKLDPDFQMLDFELSEITINAFNNGIDNSQLASITSFKECSTYLEVFEKICERNKNWMDFISNTIESNNLQSFLKGSTKDVLIIDAKAQIDNRLFNNQYELILSINLNQAHCQFNEEWYNCKDSQPVKSKGPILYFPSTLVYLRKSRKPLLYSQKPAQSSYYEPGPEYRRDTTANFPISPVACSDPALLKLNNDSQNSYSKRAESKQNVVLSAEEGTEFIQKKQLQKQSLQDNSNFHENMKFSNPDTNENYFGALKSQLVEELEMKIDYKLKISQEAIEKKLTQCEDKFDSSLKNLELKYINSIEANDINQGEYFSCFEQEVLKKLNELSQCVKAIENNQSSLNLENLTENARNSINTNYNKINTSLNELSSKIVWLETIIEKWKKDADIFVQSIRKELKEIKNNQSENANSSLLEDLNRKIKRLEDECTKSIEKINTQKIDIEELLKNNKSEINEKIDNFTKKLNKELQDYKSQIDNNQLRHPIDTQNCDQIEKEDQISNNQIHGQSPIIKNYSKSGLPNIGNTCYMNSVIQILASSTEFTECIKSIHDDLLLQSLSTVISLMKDNATENEIRRHIKNFKKIISKDYSMYNGSAENDAKELCVIIFDKIKNKNLFTIVKTQKFTCNSNSQHKSYTEDSSNFIVIPKSKQNNIEEFLNNIRERKEFFEKNQLQCERCKRLRNTTLETEKIIWPSILTIYMPNHELKEEIPDSLQVENDHYQVFGVICYYGNHFIAFTKNNNEWEKYSDSRVSKGSPDWGQLYLAFYTKINQ